MVRATALKELFKNNKVVGYVLKDSRGNEMKVDSNSIKNALQQGKIEIDNIKINSDGELVFVKDTVEPKTEGEVKTVAGNKSDSERMIELVEILNKARYAYEQEDREIMSNFEYDKLYDELLALEKKTGTTLSNSPTINVGYEVVSELPKERHTSPMLSLAKTKSVSDVVNFVGNQNAIISWKMDGLTVVLTYIDGKLAKAVTRGNGEVGELVTSNAKQFKNIPLTIPYKNELVIRGEAAITYSDFNRINAGIADEMKYKNPRNLASGSVRQLDSSITAQRSVKFYAFTLVDPEKHNVKTVGESFDFLTKLGFKTVDHMLITRANAELAINKFTEAAKNHKIDIPVDGLVITYDNIAYGKSLGLTAKTPRHSIALKWEDEEVVTTIRDIEWSASKTGLLNPVAIFDPVDIEGSTVSRASVHNVSIFAGLELGYGDQVKVYKANMIIPQISENLTRSGTFGVPSICPVCGGPTELRQDPNSGVYTLYCINSDCPAKGNRLLKHFVSRDAMNIDGISGATLEKLASFGIIDSFASVFRIKNHPEIASIEGFGMTSFRNMVNAVEKARNVKPANLVYALSIPNVGLQTAKVICKHFNNDIVAVVNASYNELARIDGIGDVIASSFYNWFHNSENAQAFLELFEEVNVIQEAVVKADSSDPIYGKTFCVTGAVYIFSNRDQVKAVIESRGGKLTGSVSKSTNYLITNDTGSGSRKNKAAQEFGIPILTEQEFINKFNIRL